MKNIFLLLLTIAFYLSACQTGNNPNNETAETKQLVIKQGKIDKTAFANKLKLAPANQLIDVRTPEEFNEGHIENAVNIDFYSDQFIDEINKSLDKNKTVFLYCKSGGRSGKAYTMLKENGFKEVYDLKGGYSNWK